MKKASEYLRNAQECRRLIASVTDPQQQAMLQKMADTWESLAADRERRVVQNQRIADLEHPRLPRKTASSNEVRETQKPPPEGRLSASTAEQRTGPPIGSTVHATTR